MPTKRRETRTKVMYVLYAHAITNDPVEKVKKDLLTEIDKDEIIRFANPLIEKVLENNTILETKIEAKLKHWEFERVALLDKILIKMALAEIMFMPEVPPKVSINEAIELAKEYCARASGRFVNGILDSLYRDLKSNNKIEKRGRGLLELKKKKDDK